MAGQNNVIPLIFYMTMCIYFIAIIIVIICKDKHWEKIICSIVIIMNQF